MRKRIFILACVLCVAGGLTACGEKQDKEKISSESTGEVSETQGLEVQESGAIEIPENAEGQLR